MNSNSTVRVQVGRGGDQAVAHVRLHTLGASRTGLASVMSFQRASARGERVRRRDRGTVLVGAMLMCAGAGWRATTSSIGASQPGLFGMVPPHSTLYGTFRQLNLDTLGGCRRRWVRWGRGVVPRRRHTREGPDDPGHRPRAGSRYRASPGCD